MAKRYQLPVFQVPYCVVLCTFPPETMQGRMLSGVGVPDLRGSQSKRHVLHSGQHGGGAGK